MGATVRLNWDSSQRCSTVLLLANGILRLRAGRVAGQEEIGPVSRTAILIGKDFTVLLRHLDGECQPSPNASHQRSHSRTCVRAGPCPLLDRRTSSVRSRLRFTALAVAIFQPALWGFCTGAGKASAPAATLCAGHGQQLGGGSPLPNLMEVKG
jgi:hypothetical protein